MAQLTRIEHEALAKYAHMRWGLVLNEKKRVMVENRILKARASLGSRDLLALLESQTRDPDPRIDLVLFDALSTNFTTFFREAHHFDLLKKDVLQPWKEDSSRPLRIWSAGCSEGCEPYTISILLNEMVQNPGRKDARVLATDLSTGALSAARKGIYTREHMVGTDPQLIQRYFTQGQQLGKPAYTVNAALREPITFSLLNLLEPWVMRGPFDAIFCRNVMIYFDRETREKLARRFTQLIRPGGLLFIGTSESLEDYDLPLKRIAHGAYRPDAEVGSRWAA